MEKRLKTEYYKGSRIDFVKRGEEIVFKCVLPDGRSFAGDNTWTDDRGTRYHTKDYLLDDIKANIDHNDLRTQFHKGLYDEPENKSEKELEILYKELKMILRQYETPAYKKSQGWGIIDDFDDWIHNGNEAEEFIKDAKVYDENKIKVLKESLPKRVLTLAKKIDQLNE